ncbi:hypothetical protein [Luteimonas aestuarii]|uniref:hypothetical protein n=1 Tax=Luteimonas aestuarii TaxID=453837 RepID=UPI001FB65DCC|nr:hypothetical protein [Luteimonas aestuarii]
MKFRLRSRGTGTLFWLSLFSVYAVAAAGVVVLDANSRDHADLSQVATVTVYAPEEMRAVGAAQMAAVYRASSGTPFTSLPPGSTVRVVWPDGSSEYVAIVNPAARNGVRTLPGTQRNGEWEEVAPGTSEKTQESARAERVRGRPQSLEESARDSAR